MVIVPGPFAITIPGPAVIFAITGLAPTEPIGICPFPATAKEVKDPVAFPTCNAWFVVPVKLNVIVLVPGFPVPVILLPPLTLILPAVGGTGPPAFEVKVCIKPPPPELDI